MNSSEEKAPPLPIRIASALFEIEAGDPDRTARIVMRSVIVLVAILLLWSIFAKLDIVAVAQGRLVPQTYVKIVQPADAGIIREILVEEGVKVAQGQVLVRLDPTVAAADTSATARELQLQRLQLRRIESELADTSMPQRPEDDATLFAQVSAQHASHRQSLLDAVGQASATRRRANQELGAARELLEKLEITLPSYERTATAYKQLANENLVGAIQAEERKREAIEKAQDLEAQRATVASLEAALAESEQRLAQIRSAYANELNQSRMETITAITRLEQQQQRLTYQQGLLELRAPQAGIVKELATTTVGAVVQPGSVLLSLVPQDEPLMAEVSIENKDIGFVAPNQPVRVKVAAYQFQRYGMLEGIVRNVSADSASQRHDEQVPESWRAPTFKALIELKEQKLEAADLILPLAAGMQVSVEIVQGKRTVLEYLLSPVQRVASEAGMER
ncbi:MAG TPA: HlyD family type I secretion periplasmic adaptor subunit [Povalibacter sp.]|uniref:HlyD family type I secretion periplasmic adaptor subunit n=1 Tax=Povalibacter sp. TaxID=1962978 RepID=UPI002CC2D2D8|nr:HlyD family type I secretion periplasmic adaptor subunit [Povalibacter sp.]HMN45975.1 HlyD family type I secretion periplasmic adaptor subunit [Povalibacter sp.]